MTINLVREPCRYCGEVIWNWIVGDGRKIAMDGARDLPKDLPGTFDRSHWRTCKALKQKGSAMFDTEDEPS